MGDEPRPDWEGIRERFIGLDESFSVKSYYPQLRQRLKELEENRVFLEEKSAALINLLEDFEEERTKAIESEARLKAVFDNLPFALWSADTAGTIQLVNETAASRYGMSPGQPLDRLSLDAELHGFLKNDFHSSLGGAVEKSERRIAGAEGDLWIQAISAPIVADGAVKGVLGADIDVSRLKSAEESLASLNEALESKVHERTEQLRSKISELRNTQDRLVLSEKLAALGRLTAGIAHELNSPLGAIESSSLTLADTVLKSVFRMGSIFSKLPKDAVPVFFSFLAESLEQGQIIGEVGDRKRRRAYAKHLSGLGAPSPEYLAELVDELGAYDYFDVFAERFGLETASLMIESAELGVSLVRSATIIRHAAERASVVVNALKNYESVEVDGSEDVIAVSCEDAEQAALFSVDIDAALAASVELFRSKFRRGVDVKLVLEARAEVCADEASLGQVWFNIIGNALQAMEYQGILEISSKREGENVLIEIADSGPGIPESIRSRIFDPFFTTKAIGEGNGFGLVVAKRIVERCGGAIGFESRPGRTVFRVTLPAANKGESA